MFFTKLEMYFFKQFIFLNIIFFCPIFSFGQSRVVSEIQDSINVVEKSSILNTNRKLEKFYDFKNKLEAIASIHDSVYAHVLLRLGSYEFIINRNYNLALKYTISALETNTFNLKKSSPKISISCYFNIAIYYTKMLLWNKALLYYDSTINIALKHNGYQWIVIKAMLEATNICFLKGDYQKSIEKSTLGINISLFEKDSVAYLEFLNQRSQAYLHQSQLKQSLIDVEIVIRIAKSINASYQLASAYRIKGFIYATKRDLLTFVTFFAKAIQQRLITKDFGQIAEDYNDFGNFYADTVKNFNQAKYYYLKGIEYAGKNNDSLRLARINANIGNTFFQEKNFLQAQTFYEKAFNYLKLNTIDFFSNPTSAKTDLIGDKELLIFLFKSKTELLLNQYLQNKNNNYLSACVNTAMVTDSVINETRHEQLGEQSKLYWRNNTRDFYCNALEASYLAKDAKSVFFFMEKSRAVLLNDRLNELGASAHLPVNEYKIEDNLRDSVILQEQQLANLKDGTKAYEAQYLRYLIAKGNFENYIHTLEQKYPIYYQYKYNDQVPDLKVLQQFLTTNNQAFVHYFITDSIIYILGITANNTKLIKVSKAVFNITQLSAFLKMCADNQALNAHYNEFAKLSNSIYTALFQPLQIQEKRVVICADNFLIPFGALCTDNVGKHFLVQDHAFSYAYSARSLLNPFNNPAPKGDLLGIAPVSFAPYLKLPELKQSAVSLNKSSTSFNNIKLLLNGDATKYSFMKLLPQYSVVNVFSHASADSANEEPLLFMADSVIHLSELQTIKLPATQLVVLSACQTNVGKLATGEGIYSLARGFASSGIPSVAATLWKADEDAIYEITQLFDHNLALGMRKDDALQQAELAFMQHGDEKQLPYFWANMVLVGNSEPVKLSSPHYWIIILSVTGIVLFIVTLILIKKRLRLIRKKSRNYE